VNHAIVDNCHVRVVFAPNDERIAKRLSDALGTATELREQRNLSGRRFSAWLSHTTVSQQETSRPLLTAGEILQLARHDAVVLVSGQPPIRAAKLRYYSDRNFLLRRRAPPSSTAGHHADVQRPRANDWSGLIRGTHPNLETAWSELVAAESGRPYEVEFDADGSHDRFTERPMHKHAFNTDLARRDGTCNRDRTPGAGLDVDDDDDLIPA
jgi:type IV secretion system protein VirD4